MFDGGILRSSDQVDERRIFDHQSCDRCALYNKLFSSSLIIFKIGYELIDFVVNPEIGIANYHRLTDTGSGPQSVELHSIQNQAASRAHKGCATVCDF